VPDRFSIVFHDYLNSKAEIDECGEVEHTYKYDAAELVVEEVLKGQLQQGGTFVAFCSGYETNTDKSACRGMPPDGELSYASGDYGIWILRRNRVVLRDYLGATYKDALVPIDSLEMVKEYIVRDRYVDVGDVKPD
jgi:hypothetical protein